MSHRVGNHLRLDVADYDATIRRFIPGYEGMLRAAAGAVAAAQPRRVWDLGAGTGALAQVILERCPAARVDLLDVDPDMIDQARHRLAAFGERVRFTLRSYDEPLAAGDAFATSLALHHIPTMEAKAALYRRVFDALSPGGVLVNADAFVPATGAPRDAVFRHWADHMVASGIPEQRAWRHFDEWAEEDTYQPLEVELDALAACGFAAERIWSDGHIGVVVARKPGPRHAPDGGAAGLGPTTP